VGRAARSRQEGEPLKYKAPKRRVFISEKHAAARLKFAKLHKDDSHKSTVFTDSKIFKASGSRNGRLGQFRWVPESESNVEYAFKETMQVHVYGGISNAGKTKLHVVSGTTGLKRTEDFGKARGVGALEYQHVLKTTLISGARELYPRTPWTFMQDGAKAHTAKSTKALLDKECPHWIKDWPASAMDLNPIENVWGAMSERLCGRRFNTVEEYTAAIYAEWDRLPQGYIRKLVGGVWRRLRDVRKNNGGLTKY
jgi:hypothetical protein